MSSFDRERARTLPRPEKMPEIDLRGSLADLHGELAKARILDAAVRHFEDIGAVAADVDFTLHFGLSW
jgi:hypothetical protein